MYKRTPAEVRHDGVDFVPMRTWKAALLAQLTSDSLTKIFWIAVILIYYVFATLLPIDKIIGKCYPVFGVILIIMALCIAGGIIFSPQYSIPEISFQNLHPSNLPVWPFMFVTVACGAISDLGQSGVVYEISHEMLGRFGGILAVVGVVICPITSGDTAFRSARLILLI